MAMKETNLFVKYVEKEIQFDPSIYIMDRPKCIVSNQNEEESINPYKPSVLSVVHRQTVQNQIRRGV